MRMLAIAALFVIAMSSHGLAGDPPVSKPPDPGCPEDIARQGLQGAVSAFDPLEQHTPGPSFLSGESGGSAWKTPWGQVGLAVCGTALNAIYQAVAQKREAPAYVKAVLAASAFAACAIPLGWEQAVMNALYGGGSSIASSASEFIAPGESKADVAVRATVNGMGNAVLAAVTISIMAALGAVEITVMVPAMVGAGGMATISTLVSALPAWVSCDPAPPPVPTPVAVGAPTQIPLPEAMTPDPVSVPIPTCTVGKAQVFQMQSNIEAAYRSGKSFNYGEAQNAMKKLVARVTIVCESETASTASESAGSCAEQKDILAKFRGTVETACKTDKVWCAQAQTTLYKVLSKTNEICERERVANQPRSPRTKTAKRAPQPVHTQPQPGPSATDVATAVIIGAGIASAVGGRSRGPVYQQPRGAPQPQACHRGPDGRIHCGRN